MLPDAHRIYAALDLYLIGLEIRRRLDLYVDHAKRPGIWKREHYLDRMTLKQLFFAYFQYYTIQGYIILAALSIFYAAHNPPTLLAGIATVVVVFFLYPMIWYILHRWVLHSQFMYKSPLTASAWKRVHYDHHQDPNRLSVLFGALYTTVPTIALATMPVGWLIGGAGGAAVGFATGVIMTCLYEFGHCIQHLSYKPKSKYLQFIKKRHLEHHFYDEKGNFGVTSFWPDRMFHTLYVRKNRPKSPTVFNLGYTKEVAERYPWVARLSGGVEEGHPRQRERNLARARAAQEAGTESDEEEAAREKQPQDV